MLEVDVPLVEIHVGLLADQVAVAAAHALDFGQGVHDFLFAIDLFPFVSVSACIASALVPSLRSLGGIGEDVRWC